MKAAHSLHSRCSQSIAMCKLAALRGQTGPIIILRQRADRVLIVKFVFIIEALVNTALAV